MKEGSCLGLNIADMPVWIKLANPIIFSYIKSTLGDYLKPIKKPCFYIYINIASQREQFSQKDGIKIIPQNGCFVLVNKRKPNQELGFIDKTEKFCQLNIRPEATKILFHPFLMSSFSLFLSELDGFIIHSAGLIYKGCAYIFIGPSGSGKTTVASILKKKGLNIISDEKIIIRKKGPSFMAYAFPWARDKNQFAPVKNILFLKKSNRVAFRRLKSPYAISKILSNITLNLPDQGAIQKILNTLPFLFKKLPSYEMEFLKDDSFWQSLKDLN